MFMEIAAKLNSQPRFATVILSFNHPDLTERCVRSALEILPPETIVLVHNGSEERWIHRQQKQFPQIHHLILKHNKGFTGGANAGLRKAFEQTAWVLFLTNDCKLLKTTNPPQEPGFFAPLIWARKIGRIDSLGGVLDLQRAHLRHLKEPNFKATAQERFYVPGTAFWMHRSVFERAEGFDEGLGTYWEDVDLSLKAAKLGLRLDIEPDTEILHGIGKTCHSSSHYTTYLYQRNRRRVCLKQAEKKPWLRAQMLIHLSRSWLSLGLRKMRRGQWQDLKKLSAAIRDVSPD
jgi:GT2 family glycosyltransferase